MTKAKKETAPVVDLEKKKDAIEMIERAEKGLAELRADIENDDNPDVTLFIVTCNEKTSAVSSIIIGSHQGLTTSLASTVEDERGLQSVIRMALALST